MYKKKSNKPLYFAVAAAIILIAALVVLQLAWSKRAAGNAEPETETETESETETETEIPAYNVLLYKSSSGTIEFDAEWLITDSDSDSVLRIAENTLVTMLITPASSKALESVDVLDYDMRTVSSVLRSSSGTEGDVGGEMRLSFVMPGRDIFINFNFTDLEPANDTETEPETETETEEGMPYGLTLHRFSKKVAASYSGKFDEREFLQALGDTLHLSSPYSEYRTVTDVYFGDAEETDPDKVAYHIYFNKDKDWELLAVYYVNEDSFVFTEAEKETEAETEAAGSEEEENSIQTSAVTGYENTSGTGSSSGRSTGSVSGISSGTVPAVTSSLDLLSVSTVFLAYVGDEDAFYQAAFDYILSKGRTGSTVGTMSGYEIDPEGKTATIRIMLSTGGTITGVYDKAENTYSFSGL